MPLDSSFSFSFIDVIILPIMAIDVCAHVHIYNGQRVKYVTVLAYIFKRSNFYFECFINITEISIIVIVINYTDFGIGLAGDVL